MKQQLWVLNSSLLSLFLLSMLVLGLLHQNPPLVSRMRPVAPLVAQEVKPEEKQDSHEWDSIFKMDLFGTYVAQPEPRPVKTSLAAPVPEPMMPNLEPIPEVRKQDFIDPLTLTIKGIITASHEDQIVAMIEDETKKEGVYHVGDRYKDAQIIKIARNHIIFLRANGQQEVFYLRKDDAVLALDGADKWQYIAKKIDDEHWHIDPDNFKHEIGSVGSFIDRTNILGAAYRGGKSVGLRIGASGPDELAAQLGLNKGDIVTAVNGVSVIEAKNRMKIYDMLTAVHVGDNIAVNINRAGSDIVQQYKLEKLRKTALLQFLGDAKPGQKADATLEMSKAQEREKQDREFELRHHIDQQKQGTNELMRKRLLENLRSRLQNARVL